MRDSVKPPLTTTMATGPSVLHIKPPPHCHGNQLPPSCDLNSDLSDRPTSFLADLALNKAGAVKDYIKMMLETEQLKFLVFAHHLSMLQACTEAVIEAKFERNKQHDIRSFFSPSVNKEKKRKRTGDSPI
ncbi:uncharacterized protein LOC127987275 isoform X2 [Carassius gibelio]|uniref:uncharacterized protein LOC127987275 isoform X2 n=1 Tax=Carassius gibelio TaxID=101364 RepID=UPI0022777601|nr:uncharacterized protein LOC127987275 isoform X2 [Carassius gibelio]